MASQYTKCPTSTHPYLYNKSRNILSLKCISKFRDHNSNIRQYHKASNFMTWHNEPNFITEDQAERQTQTCIHTNITGKVNFRKPSHKNSSAVY